MKLLLDQGISKHSVAEFTALGHEAVHANTLGQGAIPDEVILAHAVELGAVIVTSDSDFHAMIAQDSLHAPSVIRLRVEGLRPVQVARLVHQGILVAQERGLVYFAMSIDKDRVAMRPLPLR